MGSVGPLGVRTPSGLPRAGTTGGSLRSPALLALSSHVRGPSRHPRTVAGTPRGPRVRRCFLPWAFLPHDTYRNGRPVPARPPGPAACRVRGLGTSFAASTPVPAGTLTGPRASTGFTLRGVLLAPVGPPLGGPCPPAVRRVDSPRSLRCVRTRPASGPRSRRRARSVLRALAGAERRCLLALPPSRALSPIVLSGALFAPAPPPRVGRDDVPTRLRLEVLRIDRCGWPLSGLPALLGFFTLRPSRHRRERTEGGLMASPCGQG